jgi:hypothetical protein
MLSIALHIFGQELPSNRSRRHHVVVAIVTTPLREVVSNIESSWRWGGIFIVDEVDMLSAVLERRDLRPWKNDDVRA